MTDTTELLAAVEHMADVLDTGMIGDAARHFTCFEADAIAEVLRAAGRDETADTWLRGHADADDEGDSHYDLRDDDDD